MNIYIVANFLGDLNGKSADRFIYLAERWAEKGHDVHLVTSDFYHTEKKYRKDSSYVEYTSKVILCHEPKYNNNISIKRIISHSIWGYNVYNYIKRQRGIDVIYCAIPSLTAAYKVSQYAKKNNIRFIIDIQDLWPEAFCMIIKSSIIQQFFKPFEWLANRIYSNATDIVAVSKTYVDRALSVNKKGARGICVFLGNDGKLFENIVNKSKPYKEQDEFVLGYIGTLGYSYDIHCVIDALLILKKKPINKSIKFILLGDGPLREDFENYAKEKGIICNFMGLKPYHEMVQIMSSFDIVINPIVKGSAASIINKVGDYALAGKPVINTQECPEYRQLIVEYNCGINCNCGDVFNVASALERLILDPDLRIMMSKNSRVLGIDKFDRRNTYNQIIELIK